MKIKLLITFLLISSCEVKTNVCTVVEHSKVADRHGNTMYNTLGRCDNGEWVNMRDEIKIYMVPVDSQFIYKHF